MYRSLLIAALCCMQSLPADDTITTRGNASVVAIAEQASISLSIEVQGNSAKQAERRLSKRQAAVLERLREEEDVSGVETRNFSLYPRYSNDKPNKIVGYIGRSTVAFESTVAESGRLAGVGIEAGASTLQGINVKLSDAQRQEAYMQAIDHAAKDALSKARATLSALDLEYIKIRRIEVDPRGATLPRTFAFAAKAESADLEVTPQDVQVSAEIELEVEFGERD